MPNSYYTRTMNPQPTQRVGSNDLKSEFQSVEGGFDEVAADMLRTLKVPATTTDQLLNLTPASRANLVLAFDASGNPTAIAYGRYRGDWVTGTAYVVSDYFRDPTTKNIYAVVLAHTAGVLVDDVAAGKVRLSVNVADVEAAKSAAQAAEAGATAQVALAAAQAELATTNGAAQVALAAAQASNAALSAADSNTAKLAAQAAQAAAEAIVATIPEGTINDATTSLVSVWSSSKTSSELGGKLNATNPVVTGTITEDVYAITDGGSVDINPANGSIQTWTLGASRSPTATSFAAGQSVILMVTAGANAVTWPSVTWSKVGGSGAAPNLTATGATCVILWKVGSTLYGSLLGSV